MRKICVVFALMVGLLVSAQPRQRSQQYKPDGYAFVCDDGTNRYTRALYGSHTDWRLETSDRPVFAVVKKGHHRNISLRMNGVALDSADHCRTYYVNGARAYFLSDSRWADVQPMLEVLALPDAEAAIFHLVIPPFEQMNVEVTLSQIAQPKLFRNGDLGVDPPGVFEAAGEPLQRLGLTLETELFFEVDLDTLRMVDTEEGQQTLDRARQYFTALAERIQFDTPDPYINTLGSALALAADGDWDGQTWLHGCIGWRMPLAGWRAGYLGDVLGWNDRAVSHFDAYAKSQVTDVPPTIPHPSQDPAQNLARAEKRWGTQMYSNGYICRNPKRNDQMHHYDMNLNYIDELLWHFQYDADTAYMRKMWPVVQSHLAWEKRNFDSDGDHLYDAYCCIWASDALYYSGGAVTHSSAYNYRGNRLAARMADIIGEDPKPYREEADAILKAMNERLWLPAKGVWAEYQDAMGLRRVHDHPAVWSIYTPIDCGACSAQQAYLATRYVDEHIPHISLELRTESLEFPTDLRTSEDSTALANPQFSVLNSQFSTISTSDWLPYSWSINNVAAAEVMHTALAYFQAGRSEEGYRLMKANILDQMYYGASPGNFGQISYYDAARGECYRDFGDCIGISSRTLLQGLFGIIPQALDGKCIIRPGFPADWKQASVKTPYIEYKYTRKGSTGIYEITQHFRQPLKIVLRQNLGNGEYHDVEGTTEEHQVIYASSLELRTESSDSVELRVDSLEFPTGLQTNTGSSADSTAVANSQFSVLSSQLPFRPQIISHHFNASVSDIFKNRYLSPRPQSTTLQIPVQGIGEWCHPQLTAEINDSVFRTLIQNGEFNVAGVPFRTPAEGRNIIYTSLWDNYPDSVVIPLKGKAERVWLLMAGSTNHMQSRIDNGLVVVTYSDHTTDTLALRNPDNWCPIEQDYYVDDQAFAVSTPRPYRVCLGTGDVSRDLGKVLDIRGVYGREIPGGAAQMLCLPLRPKKKLRSLTLRTLSNDVVIGLMAVTLQ